jgi:hypothetical protein
MPTDAVVDNHDGIVMMGVRMKSGVPNLESRFIFSSFAVHNRKYGL